MNNLIITTVYKDSEISLARAHNDRYGDKLRIVSDLKLDFGNVWPVPDSNKFAVEWTKRFLRLFLNETEFDGLLKIDPDTTIRDLPLIPDCDVAGDFRKSDVGWLWLGGFQFFTKHAVNQILNDSLYTGNCVFQDVELAKSIQRLNLKAYNLENIDCWNLTNDQNLLVYHPGKSKIKGLQSGFVTF